MMADPFDPYSWPYDDSDKPGPAPTGLSGYENAAGTKPSSIKPPVARPHTNHDSSATKPRPAPAPPRPSTSTPPKQAAQTTGNIYEDKWNASQQANAQTPGKPVSLKIPSAADGRPVVFGYSDVSVTESGKVIAGASDFIPSKGHYRPPIPNQTSVYAAQNSLMAMMRDDPDRYKWVVAAMKQAGVLGERATSFASIQAVWSDLVKTAADDYEANGMSRRADVFTLLADLAAAGPGTGPDGGGGGDDGGGGGYGGTSTSTAFDQDLTLTNPDNAKTLANAALSQYLGRDAKPAELKQFLAALNAHERANPRTQQSTVTQTVGGSAQNSSTTRSSSTVSAGGVNPQQFAEDWAREQEGTAEYTAATKYLNTFMSAIQDQAGVL